MANQMPREDLFTPIHKGIRSMIYELGTKLQRTDFTNISATEAIISQLKYNLKSANSACIVCMLHQHGEHEEQSVFPQIAPYDSKLVDTLIQEHVEITRISDEILQLKDNALRIEMGTRLNRMANSLLAFYLIHLNNEEDTILPLTWKYLTDDLIRAIRTKIQMSLPPEKYAEWMRWIIPSLNINELVGIFSGMKMAAPPQLLEKMMYLAEENLDHGTWNSVKVRVNL